VLHGRRARPPHARHALCTPGDSPSMACAMLVPGAHAVCARQPPAGPASLGPGVQAMLAAFRAGNAVHVPGLKKLLEQRCAGARISALSRELAAASGVAFPL